MYKRVLLKVSGEALSQDNAPYFKKNLDNVAIQVKQAVNDGIQIGIVCGGGNIYRGKIGTDIGIERQLGDYMGMLATCMNALAISNSLNQVNVKNHILTAVEIPGIGELFNSKKADEYLSNNEVCIYAFGTGHPYFSTDTCSALRALQTNCDIILVAKNGVDGIYNADPRKDSSAKRYDSITYQEILEKNLQVMDLTAISLCKDNKLPLFVFNMNQEGNIYKACKENVTGTTVR